MANHGSEVVCGYKIRSIVKNPTYKGARAYNRLKKTGIGMFAPRYWVKDPDEWLVIEDAHAPIVIPEIWKAANPSSKDTQKGRRAISRFDNPYLLSGLIKCSRCGFNFVGQSQTVGSVGNRWRRRTYADSGYAQKGPTVCQFMSIEAETFEQKVLAVVEQKVVTSSLRDLLLQRINEHLDRRSVNPQNEIEQLRTRIIKVRNQISSLVSLAARGVNLDEIAGRLKELENQRNDLEAQISRATASRPARTEIETAVTHSERFFEYFSKNFGNAPPIERKNLVREIVRKIELDRYRRVARLHLGIYRGARRIIWKDCLKTQKHSRILCPQRDSNSCYRLENPKLYQKSGKTS